MTLSLEGCRAYAHGAIDEAVVGLKVSKYKCDLASKVDDICLEMGCLCADNKAKYEHLGEKLTQEINALTTDAKEKDNLIRYVHRIINVGRNFLFLNRASLGIL